MASSPVWARLTPAIPGCSTRTTMPCQAAQWRLCDCLSTSRGVDIIPSTIDPASACKKAKPRHAPQQGHRKSLAPAVAVPRGLKGLAAAHAGQSLQQADARGGGRLQHDVDAPHHRSLSAAILHALRRCSMSAYIYLVAASPRESGRMSVCLGVQGLTAYEQ